MDNCADNNEPRRVTVQTIRERFENHQRYVPMVRSPTDQPAEMSSEVDSNHSGSSSVTSESDSTGGFQQHNRTSIKRSPAFRTGHKSTTEVISDSNLQKKQALKRDTHLVVINNNNHKKPSLRRKPGVDRTSKPNLSPEPTSLDRVENDPLIEEALRAPLPTGPAPKKPPRTFLHDAYIQRMQQCSEPQVTSRDEPDGGSPQRPTRRNKPAAAVAAPQKPVRPTSIALGTPFAMSRSKTEPFLLGRKKSLDSDPVVEDLRQSPLDNMELFRESRWLNPVQWNSFNPVDQKKSPLKTQTSPRVSASMLTIADPALLRNDRHHPLAEPRRLSCDFDGRHPTELTWQSSTGLLGFHGRKEPPASLSHVYEQPTLEGGLHYMVRHFDLFAILYTIVKIRILFYWDPPLLLVPL